LLDKLKNSPFPIFSIEELLDLTHKITGVPKQIIPDERIIGYVEYRDGTIIDCLRKINYESK